MFDLFEVMKYFILLLSASVLVLSKSTFNRNLDTYRRKPSPPDPMDMFFLNDETTKRNKDDRYYEPYWDNGDWVFYRKASTKRRQAHFLNKGNTTQHDECNQVCPKIFELYKTVCGMRLDHEEYRNEFRTFDNLCQLQLANCVHHKKRQGWYPIKKGNCTSFMTTHPVEPTQIVSRKIIWEGRYNK